MSGIENWFIFSSKEDRERRHRDYFNEMFPFGEEQKRCEEALLAQHIQAPVKANEKLYQLLVVKGALGERDEQRRARELKRWYNSRLIKSWPHESRTALLAMAELCRKAQSNDELPDGDMIAVRCTELERDVMPGLKSKRRPWSIK